MKKIFNLLFVPIVISMALLYCIKDNTILRNGLSELPIQPSIDTLLIKYGKGLNKNVSIFVVLKNIDATTLKIYLVAKKALRSDFEFIGIPFMCYERGGTNYYFYTGIEKLIIPDTLFWSKHPEIYDDKAEQLKGLYEAPIVKKSLFIFKDSKIKDLGSFNDNIFVGPPVDTIQFR